MAKVDGRPWRRWRDGRGDGGGTAVATAYPSLGGGLRQLGGPNVSVWRVLPPNLKCAACSVAVGRGSA